MSKTPLQIDTRNPFIPSRSRICRAADSILILNVVLAGLAAVTVAVLKAIWA